jgi:hypothetical protein
MVDWISFVETSDTLFLQYSRKYKRSHCQEAVNNIHRDFIRNFGLSLDAKFILQKKIKIELLEIERITTKNESLSSLIAIELAELSKYTTSEVTDYYQIWADVESVLGFRLNSKSLTVFEFYNYLKKVKKDYDVKQKHLDNGKR